MQQPTFLINNPGDLITEDALLYFTAYFLAPQNKI